MKIRTCFISMLAMTFAATANATECPQNKDGHFYGHVHDLHYKTGDYYPTFTLKEYGDNWLRLSPSYGLNTDYGRALYAMLLHAKAAGAKIKISCYSDGRVDELWVLGNKPKDKK